MTSEESWVGALTSAEGKAGGTHDLATLGMTVKAGVGTR